MRTNTLLAILALLILNFREMPAHAETVVEQWVKRYNGTCDSTDVANAVAVDGAGNVIVTGYSNDGGYRGDFFTAKYTAADGALLWEKRHNGPANGADAGIAVTLDNAGNVIVTGSWSESGGYSSDYYTAKYAAADGALLWEKRYGSANGAHRPSAVALDSTGNVIVTGQSNSGYYTAKYAAANGALLWEKGYHSGIGAATAVAVDTAGHVIVTGHSGGDFYTAKYAAANGALLWEKVYGDLYGNSDVANAVAVDTAGNVIVTGFTGFSFGSGGDYYTAKYAAANGALLWEKHYNGPANGIDVATGIAVDSAGNVIVSGHSARSGSDTGDYHTLKYAAANGALLWEKRYNGLDNSYDIAAAVTLDSEGNVIVTGHSGNSGSGGAKSDYYTAKYAAADGALLWEKRYDGPGNGADEAKAVAVDSAGNVIVTGQSNSDHYTAKYAAASGASLWEQRYNGMANSDDVAKAVAVDHAGNVIVTGDANFDYYTAKYAAANGALLWEHRYNSPGNGWDVPAAVAVDNAGNVIVTGTSDNEFYTVKYAAADGAVLWEQRSNGPAGSDGASAVAVDGAGNVIVTGYSLGSIGNHDYYTAKYAGADGTLLWEKRYDGPANGDDAATAVALDNMGNALVTGSSMGIVGYSDYYTAKYAAADGALLWEQRYNGPAGGYDRATAVASDSAGNAIVTGESYDGLDDRQFFTVKYAAADGALLWEKRYDAAFDIEHGDVAVDSAGNVIVTGSTESDEPSYIAKYAAANGALLWEKLHGTFDAASSAIDSGGNVIVTGRNVDSADDYYTAKYAAADGTLLWEKRYDGLITGLDGPRAVAVDSAGNVIVTGVSTGDSSGPDYATVKYAAAIDADHDGLLDPWELGRFGTTVGHSALDDYDLDGRVELLEMAFAGDPRVPDAEATPVIVEEGGYLTITVAKQPGVTYLAQSAGTPGAPAFSASTTTLLINDPTTLKARDNFPIGAPGSRFMRVKVNAAP